MTMTIETNDKGFKAGYTRSLKALQLLVFSILSFPAFFVSAANSESDLGETTVSGKAFNAGLSADSLLQVFMVLIFIVLLIFALSVVLKKFNMLPAGSGKLIKIISAVSLSNKDRLLLIQVGDEQLLISSSPGSINKIHTLANPIEIETDSGTQASDKINFNSLLNSILKKEKS